MKNDGQDILESLGIPTERLLGATITFKPGEVPVVDCVYAKLTVEGDDVQKSFASYYLVKKDAPCPST